MNIDDKEIEKLANLARIKISDTEKEKLRKDIESILAYVSDIQSVSSASKAENSNEALLNVMREDDNPHPSGIYTDKLIGQVPQQDRNYVKVKKIL